MNWTAERAALLKRLWAAGRSASEIAHELGDVSRNAVIGKAHRLGLASRSKTAAADVKRRANASSNRKPGILNSKPPEPLPPERKPPMESMDSPCTFMALTPRSCRWPIGDPRESGFKFCGCKKIDGLPYCDHHVRIAYQAAPVRR